MIILSDIDMGGALLGAADFFFGYLEQDYVNHYHDCYEFHYILKGGGEFHQEGERVTLLPDTFLVSPPGVEHSFVIEPDLTFYFLRYKPDRAKTGEIDQLESHYYLSEENRSDLSRLRLLLNGDDHSRQAGEYFLLSFLHTLMAEKRPARFHRKPLIQAYNYMMDNLYRKITLQELADLVHLEKHYFCRLFKESAYVSPLVYFERLKMEAACSMIDQGTRGYVIAEKLGFCDETYFSRRFSKIVGVSPGEYRKHGSLRNALPGEAPF